MFTVTETVHYGLAHSVHSGTGSTPLRAFTASLRLYKRAEIPDHIFDDLATQLVSKGAASFGWANYTLTEGGY